MPTNYIGMDLSLGWDSSIGDGAENILLPPGEYNFRISDLVRDRYNGSAKIPPCPKATITVEIETEQGVASFRTDLILSRVVEWRLGQFFRCIGQKKRGERMAMDWNRVVGSRGRAIVKVRRYKDSAGNEHDVNDIDRYLDYDPAFFTDEAFKTVEDGSSEDEELPFH